MSSEALEIFLKDSINSLTFLPSSAWSQFSPKILDIFILYELAFSSNWFIQIISPLISGIPLILHNLAAELFWYPASYFAFKSVKSLIILLTKDLWYSCIVDWILGLLITILNFSKILYCSLAFWALANWSINELEICPSTLSIVLLYSFLEFIQSSCPFLEKSKISIFDASLYAFSISFWIWDGGLDKLKAISINFLCSPRNFFKSFNLL